MADIDVTFTDDIPKIEREGGGPRKSKYKEILDACVERAGKAAKFTVDTQGQASSRASSIRTAADKHPAQVEDQGVFIVATRSVSENEFDVYVKFAEKNSDDYEQEKEREAKAAERPKKKAVKKKVKKTEAA